jgi:hypothetical protein
LLFVRLFWAGIVVTVVGVLSFGHGGRPLAYSVRLRIELAGG